MHRMKIPACLNAIHGITCCDPIARETADLVWRQSENEPTAASELAGDRQW